MLSARTHTHTHTYLRYKTFPGREKKIILGTGYIIKNNLKYVRTHTDKQCVYNEVETNVEIHDVVLINIIIIIQI